MKIAMSSGHGKYIRGASGPQPIPPYCDEVDEVRKIVESVATALRAMKPPVEVVTFHDNTSHDQSTNLSTITSWHNKQSRDLDVSVHLNCYDQSAHGVEVLYVTQQALAAKVSAAIAKVGFTDRGAKKRTDLAFLNNTNKPSVLIENHFCDNKQDCETYRSKYDQVVKAIAESLSGQQAQPGPTPPTPPEIERPEPPSADGHPTIGKGDKGEAVEELQDKLGVLIVDGDFGEVTATWVKAFQGACGLSADGVVGAKTWQEVDALQDRVDDAPAALPQHLAEQIYTLAQQSEIAEFSWPDRGVPPPGYIAAMAECFAVAFMRAEAGDPAAKIMEKELGSADVDALARYRDELATNGIALTRWDQRLRALFVLLIGLGPRESSGRYFEGRDMSASNVASDTCEAGLFQTSWNIRNAHPSIGPLLPEFWEAPAGFLEVFKQGLSPSANNLNSYGSGDGIRYQFLSRFAPLFHVLVTAVGMRTLCQHWGPIKRYEVTVKKEADDLLREVQSLIEDLA